MAGGGTIETSLKIDGEAQYNKALKEAHSNLKRLKSQLNAATSSMGKNATAQQKATVRAENLRKKIAEQEKIVKQLQGAVAQATAQYGQNSVVANKWATKLYEATAALNNMKHSLQDVTDAGYVSAQQMANMGQALQTLKSMASSAAGGVKAVFSNLKNDVKVVSRQIGDLMTQAMNTVGGYKAISDVYGGSDEAIQKFLYGFSPFGATSGNVSAQIQNLVKRTHAGTNADMMRQLGVAEDHNKSHWDYYYEVMSKLADRNENERYSMAEALFGDGQADDVTALLEHWDEAKKFEGNRSENGAWLTQGIIDQVDSAQRELQQLQAMYDATRSMIGAELIVKVGVEDIAKAGQSSLGSLMKLIDATTEDERGKAVVQLDANIKILSESLTEGMTNLGGYMDALGKALGGSQNGYLKTIGLAVQNLGGVLNWIGDPKNSELINGAMTAMLANFVADKTGAKDVVKAGYNIIVDYMTIRQLGGIGKSIGDGFLASAGGAAAAGIGSAIATAFLGGIGVLAWLNIPSLVDAISDMDDQAYTNAIGESIKTAANDTRNASFISPEDLRSLESYAALKNANLGKLIGTKDFNYEASEMADSLMQRNYTDDATNPWFQLDKWLRGNGGQQINLPEIFPQFYGGQGGGSRPIRIDLTTETYLDSTKIAEAISPILVSNVDPY